MERGIVTGRWPDGLTRPGEHARHRGAAFFAGEEGLDDGGALLDGPADGVRAPRHEHEHHGRSGREHGLDELALNARQFEGLDVAALAHGAAAKQARAVAHDDHGDLGRASSFDGRRDARRRS